MHFNKNHYSIVSKSKKMPATNGGRVKNTEGMMVILTHPEFARNTRCLVNNNGTYKDSAGNTYEAP